jgi:oligopeptidase B
MTTQPPKAQRHSTSSTIHGDTRVDEYAWLRDRDDPDVIAYLEAENEYTEATLAHLAPSREMLYDEIRSRVVETDMSVPVRRGPYWYYSRTVEGLNYPIHCRRPFDGEELPPVIGEGDEGGEILYDENLEAGDQEFFSVGILSINPTQQTLAIAVDTKGNERHRLTFRQIEGEDQPSEVIDDVSYGLAWVDDETVLYTRVDDTWRPFQLWRHRVGTDPATDALVYQEDDARFNIGVGRSRDDAVVLVTSSSSTTSETRYLPTDVADAALVVLCARQDGVEHGIEHLTLRNGSAWWLKVTNEDGALDFRLDASRHDGADPAWSTVVPHEPGIRLEGVDAFATCIVVSERKDAETQLRVIPLSDAADLIHDDLESTSWMVTAEARPQTTWIGPNPESDIEVLRVGHTSMVMPSTVAQISLSTHTSTILKQQQIPGGYDPSDYVTYREWATAADGVRVPISVVHHVSLLTSDGRAGDPPRKASPCLLYGYGSYEISTDPTFSVARLSLLDRGGIFAIAHVRGGGELGRTWYDQGHLEHKPNSFDDFIAVADFLIERQVTSPDLLAARGGSAGGLLMGGVANRGPDRFRAILAEVPFVDALNSMLDPSLPLTVGEYEEWGNPTDDAESYATIKSYSPYDNIIETSADGTAFQYPSMLLTTGLNDTRVGFWEAAKFVARLRFANPDNPVLLRTEMGVGHGGPSGRYDAWHEESFVLAWLLEQIQLLDEPIRASGSPRSS